MVEFDTRTRVLLAIHKLDPKSEDWQQVKEIAAVAGLSKSSVQQHLSGLLYLNRMVEFSSGPRGSTTWRLNAAGGRRANQLRLLKPNQRLIYVHLVKVGISGYAAIKKKTGLSGNGLTLSLAAMCERGVIDTNGHGQWYVT